MASVDMDIVPEQIKALDADRSSGSLTGGRTKERCVLIFARLSIDPCG